MATFRNRKGRVTAEIRRRGFRDTRTFPTLTEAKSWAKEREREIERRMPGGGFVNSKLTLAEAIERYRTERLKDLRTQRDRGYQLDFWKNELGASKLSNISPDTIGQVRERIRIGKPELKNSSINRLISALAAVLHVCATEWGYLDVNPCSRITRLREPAGLGFLVRTNSHACSMRPNSVRSRASTSSCSLL